MRDDSNDNGVCMCAWNCVITCMQVCEPELSHLSSLTMNNLQRGQLHHRWTWANCLNAGKYTGREKTTKKPTPTLPHTHTHIHPPTRLPILSLCYFFQHILLHPHRKRSRWTAAPRQNKKSGGNQSGFQEKKRSSSHNKHMKKLPQYVNSSRAGTHIHKALTYIHSNTAPLWSSSPRTH